MIRDVEARRKAVLDPSGGAVENGIERLAAPAGAWALVVCAQVLEHVSAPEAMLREIRKILRGIVYLEVPDQRWRGSVAAPRPLLEFLCRHPALLLGADLYSTFFRVKLGRLPPFGFVPMREHVNFFTPQALRSLAERCGLRVRAEGRHAGSFFLVGGLE
jgi:hypothetical protein